MLGRMFVDFVTREYVANCRRYFTCIRRFEVLGGGLLKARRRQFTTCVEGFEVLVMKLLKLKICQRLDFKRLELGRYEPE